MIGNRVNSASPSTFDSPLTRVCWTSLYGMPVAVIPASRNSFAVWSGTLTSLNAITSGFRAAISALISRCRSLQRLWPCSRLSVATRNCIGLSRRLRPIGYAALRSHSPEEVSTRVGRRAAAARFLSCSGAGQLLLARHAERPWHQARRDPTGLSPDPAVTQEAVIQVFAAPAVARRGLF